MVLLDKSGILTRDDDKKNVRFAFDVPDGTQALQIEFAYSPKTLTDPELEKQICETALKKYNGAVCYDEYKQYLPLKNLVTLSLDDPGGYRGAAHRQDPARYIPLAPHSPLTALQTRRHSRAHGT